MKEMEINKPAIIARLKAYRERKGPDAYRLVAHYTRVKNFTDDTLRSMIYEARTVGDDVWQRVDAALTKFEKKEAKRREE